MSQQVRMEATHRGTLSAHPVMYSGHCLSNGFVGLKDIEHINIVIDNRWCYHVSTHTKQQRKFLQSTFGNGMAAKPVQLTWTESVNENSGMSAYTRVFEQLRKAFEQEAKNSFIDHNRWFTPLTIVLSCHNMRKNNPMATTLPVVQPHSWWWTGGANSEWSPWSYSHPLWSHTGGILEVYWRYTGDIRRLSLHLPACTYS